MLLSLNRVFRIESSFFMGSSENCWISCGTWRVCFLLCGNYGLRELSRIYVFLRWFLTFLWSAPPFSSFLLTLCYYKSFGWISFLLRATQMLFFCYLLCSGDKKNASCEQFSHSPSSWYWSAHKVHDWHVGNFSWHFLSSCDCSICSWDWSNSDFSSPRFFFVHKPFWSACLVLRIVLRMWRTCVVFICSFGGYFSVRFDSSTLYVFYVLAEPSIPLAWVCWVQWWRWVLRWIACFYRWMSLVRYWVYLWSLLNKIITMSYFIYLKRFKKN